MALKFKQSSNPCWICICLRSRCRETWRRIPGTQSLLYFRSLQNSATCGIQIPDWRCLSATSSGVVGSRASPAVLSMWSCRVKSDEEKSKNMRVWLKKMVLSQHNCRVLQWLVKAAATLCTCRKECNKYDLTAAQHFWLVHMVCYCSSLPIRCPSFSFIGGVERKVNN
jgi:hypothetical protein